MSCTALDDYVTNCDKVKLFCLSSSIMAENITIWNNLPAFKENRNWWLNQILYEVAPYSFAMYSSLNQLPSNPFCFIWIIILRIIDTVQKRIANVAHNSARWNSATCRFQFTFHWLISFHLTFNNIFDAVTWFITMR